MKLNKLQRNFIYMIMLAEIETPSYVYYKKSYRSTLEYGLCWLYRMIFDFKFDYDFNFLPELNKYKCEDWWGDPIDWNVRKKALRQSIKKTA